ncbi:hypothetical protein H5407_00750 [Mitsuaria sp. WAJ17]|uniref:hypothetical protein n=1 Tax=Mitsuaria sp. WAJ17 TaxID=2761452 RepID=UPI00160478A6|nr:hypothetical protein [Mitsuaria sp. WAJ17]MBB2483746.1 hypothetical protein [Mitsuaria sp. WAJ17]
MNKPDNTPAEDLPPLTAQDESELEAWLASAWLDPVPDEGFSAALMQRLPDPARYRRRSMAPVWGAGLGGGLLVWQLVGTGLLPQALAGGAQGQLTPALGVVLACALGLSAGVSGWVWSERDG